MATIITKEIALRIVKKLNAVEITSRSKSHDEYVVREAEMQVAIISIRRSSKKNIGHDYLKNDLHISPHQAKELGQCPWSRDDYMECLREKGILPLKEDDDE